MNTTWIRRLYDAGSALEIRADRLIEHMLWGALRRRFGRQGAKRRGILPTNNNSKRRYGR